MQNDLCNIAAQSLLCQLQGLRMNIVIEGADNSGKSTLAAALARVLNWRIVSSPGPTKSKEEFNLRALSFLQLDRTIFDRHCIVSENIYGTIRGSIMTEPELERMYLLSTKLVVFCRMNRPTLEGHIAKAHDTPDHLATVVANQERIFELYDKWALDHANIVYRKGEPLGPIIRMITRSIP